MNYQTALSVAGGPDGIPVGSDWKRINYSLAGYGFVVPGTLSNPAPVTIDHSAQATCTITHSVKGA